MRTVKMLGMSIFWRHELLALRPLRSREASPQLPCQYRSCTHRQANWMLTTWIRDRTGGGCTRVERRCCAFGHRCPQAPMLQCRLLAVQKRERG